jgi:hypothetical protein
MLHTPIFQTFRIASPDSANFSSVEEPGRDFQKYLHLPVNNYWNYKKEICSGFRSIMISESCKPACVSNKLSVKEYVGMSEAVG